MKITFKTILSIVLLAVSLCSIFSCSKASEPGFIGTWYNVNEYAGGSNEWKITFYPDKKAEIHELEKRYSRDAYGNYVKSHVSTYTNDYIGDWEINEHGNIEVTWDLGDRIDTSLYAYKNGSLICYEPEQFNNKYTRID